MYISKLSIENFRRFDDSGFEILFNKDVNMILGENNSGKSSLIDAIRLAVNVGQYNKGIYVTLDDFNINSLGERATKIIISLCFSELTDDQGVTFYLMTDGSDTSNAELHIQYDLTKDAKGNYKVMETATGGPMRNQIPKETFDNLNLIYLPALRNAEGDLKPSRKSQIANMLGTIASTEELKEELLSDFVGASQKLSQNKSIQKLQSIINANLLTIEKDELQQEIKIDLIEPNFDGISSSLDIGFTHRHTYITITIEKFKELLKTLNIEPAYFKNKDIVHKHQLDKSIIVINVKKLKKHIDLLPLYNALVSSITPSRIPLKQNGLGYNNILSMATTLGDLQENSNPEELSLLLLEEPEAHLHPQLLDLLFSFFKKSNNNTQMFLTSHSPTLVSKSDLDSIHLLYTNDNVNIKATSINKINLTSDDKDDLKRYLDVTKSQMFFAKKIIFVEGISEAILLSEFAKILNKPLDKYSVEIVNIGGVAFEPFAKLFTSHSNNYYISMPCAIISDDDRCTNKNDLFRIRKEELIYKNIDLKNISKCLVNGAVSDRADNLKQYNKENISVNFATKTLEYELAKIESNQKILNNILKEIHPDISKDIKKKITNNESVDNLAIRIWVALSDCKSDFSQKLARYLNSEAYTNNKAENFVVPEYIKNAIFHVIPDEV